MSTKNPEESIINIAEDDGEVYYGYREVKELYIATSPFGDFVVEFELLPYESSESSESNIWKYKFRMYNVKLEKDDYSDLKASKSLSYRILSEIDISKQNTFEFTPKQIHLILSENKLSWSVAVSDKFYKDKSRKSTARLLAISCISIDDMTYKEFKGVAGFTIIFFINQDDYLIKPILTLNNHGGIVKLFSKYKVKERTDKSSQKNTYKKNTDDDINIRITNEDYQNLDRYFLIIFNVNGIHKYYFKHLSKPTGKIQSFKYPKRIYYALKTNMKFGPEFHQKYIQKCLNLHYFLVDTTVEGAQYMELYDLRTNQLVNTFERQNLNRLNHIADIPDCVAISHNNKLLAYASGSKVKLYLIESGLEIASIELKFGTVFDDDDFDYFMHFFNEDESLLIYRSKNQWAIWDIFGLEQKSIEFKDYLLEHQLEFDLKIVNILNDNCYQLERSNSFHFIFGFDHTKLELDDYYHIFEPWLFLSDVQETPRYSVYLDEKKEILLLIGSHTIQNENKSYNRNVIEKIEYAIRKFKISLQGSKKAIEMGCDDGIYIIHTVIEACYTLKFLSSIYHSSISYSRSLIYGNRSSKFLEIVEKTRNIIIRFIQLYPRLLDVRYDLLSILIEAGEKLLIKFILFDKRHKRSLHMPQKSSWVGKKENTIFRAYQKGSFFIQFADNDPIYLGYLLEYYSNKAFENIGWMITVGEIIPELYNQYDDISFFEFHAIPSTITNTLEVFIPITQLIPLESRLRVETISPDKIPDIKMVPLIDYMTNNELSLEIRGNKYMNFLKSIFCPGEFVSPDEYCNPFLSLLDKVKHKYDDLFYYNPSMEAIMNLMWYSSKPHWPPILCCL
ncbi:16117_t:CDS:2 [Gigaspora margarita]|uniref:16117_t:CDS:1 n=1 Tax=Gigaspora margarita TaxID=4874 RepID=A0ABN7W038_GIGMA|nr:16117_t:CDS:2 [Gigaspora margarita]